MTKASNKVIEGDFKGQRVLSWMGKPFISLASGETLDLSPETVASCTLLGEDHDLNLPSATIRAYIGELLFGPAGLVGAGTAERNEVNRIAIKLRDGKSCVVEVDDATYALVLQTHP